MTCLVGAATVTSEGQWQVRSLAVGRVLLQGDQVKTASKSRLEIILPDGSFMRFAENTDFTVQNIDCNQKEKKRTVRFKLALGRTWASVKKLFFGLRPKTEIATTNAVCGVRGTVFRVNVNDDQSALVRTYEGEGELKGEVDWRLDRRNLNSSFNSTIAFYFNLAFHFECSYVLRSFPRP